MEDKAKMKTFTKIPYENIENLKKLLN